MHPEHGHSGIKYSPAMRVSSLLLMMGERDKAIEVYEQVESIESDPNVRKKREELQKQQK